MVALVRGIIGISGTTALIDFFPCKLPRHERPLASFSITPLRATALSSRHVRVGVDEDTLLPRARGGPSIAVANEGGGVCHSVFPRLPLILPSQEARQGRPGSPGRNRLSSFVSTRRDAGCKHEGG
jgi:hypothetical protein